jgi:hypothetical protein
MGIRPEEGTSSRLRREMRATLRHSKQLKKAAEVLESRLRDLQVKAERTPRKPK